MLRELQFLVHVLKHREDDSQGSLFPDRPPLIHFNAKYTVVIKYNLLSFSQILVLSMHECDIMSDIFLSRGIIFEIRAIAW